MKNLIKDFCIIVVIITLIVSPLMCFLNVEAKENDALLSLDDFKFKILETNLFSRQAVIEGVNTKNRFIISFSNSLIPMNGEVWLLRRNSLSHFLDKKVE